ncbi:MAG: membrane or secreted protein [Roseivirga sp.]|nr:membrane or secreted protein [Roseivirga sp.]
MKTYALIVMFVSSFFLVLPQEGASESNLSDITGAWELESQNGQAATYTGALLIEDGYIFYTEYDIATKHFAGSLGGQYGYENGVFTYTIEFDTWSPERIGQEVKAKVSFKGKEMTVEQTIGTETSVMVYSQIDDGTGDLAGAWRITDRMRNGTMQAMRQGPRKTIKMITGSRFQWAAFNPETKQFSGTGGGSVTLKGGVYTEHIEFFSRNAERVGASLSFDYKVDGDKWDHSGMSSSGNPIREIWTRQNQ